MSIGSKLHHAYKNANLAELAFEESEGEVNESTEAAEALAELSLTDAVEALCGLVRHCANGERAAAEEMDRLAKTATRIRKAQDWAEAELDKLLTRADKTKMTAGTFRIRTRKGSERCVVTDIDAALANLPADLIRVTPEKIVPENRDPDKAAIKKWIKAGNEAPGCTLERGPRKVIVE